MNENNTVNTDLIRGHVDTIILRVLETQDRYGYEILEIIGTNSDGRYEIKQPTLYSCLKRLEKQGFITSYFGDESNGGRRRYYKLTEKGRETLEIDQREWEFSRTIIDRLLSDKQVDLKTVEAPFNPSELRPLTKRVRAYDVEEVAPIQTVADIPTSEPTQNKESVAYVAEEPKTLSESATRALNALYSDEPTTIEPTTVTQPVETEEKPIYESVFIDTVAEEEALIRKEQRINASRILQMGEFSSSNDSYNFTFDPNDVQEQNPIAHQSTPGATRPVIFGAEENKVLNYREALSAVYAETAPSMPSLTKDLEDEASSIETTARARHFNDLKQSLMEEGYKLKTYNKANSANYYYMNYVYSNRLLRDSVLLTYLVLWIELLVMIIGHKTFGAVSTYLIIGAVSVILPLSVLLIWIGNPTKRVKAQFNFSHSLLYSLIFFVAVTAISIVVSLLATSLNVDFTKGSAYVPYILALNVPIWVIIYNFLYKSNNYHLKK